MAISGSPTWKHNELIERIQKVIPDIEKQGVCFGFAHMWMQAMLIGEQETFFKRLKVIYDIPPTQLKDTLDTITYKRLDLIKEVKEKIGPMRQLTAQEQSSVEDQNLNEAVERLAHDVNALVLDGTLKEGQRDIELKRRKEALLFNAYVQQNIEIELEKLTEREQLEFEIPIFFEGIALYQQPHRYAGWFHESKRVNTAQNELAIFPLTSSKKLEAFGGIKNIKNFTGLYSQDELVNFFDSFISASNRSTLTQPIVFIFGNVDHSISVGYDPIAKTWTYINASELTIPNLSYTDSDTTRLAAIVTRALSATKFTTFSTKIYVTQESQQAASQLLTEWQQTNEWQSIHLPSAQKAVLLDSERIPWLYIAASNNELDTVNSLIASGARVNHRNGKGLSALYIASENGHVGIVKTLIEHGANINFTTNTNATPLYSAAQNNHVDVVRELLAKGASLNIRKDSGETPLHIAALEGNTQIVKLLLEYGAEVNQQLPTGETALHLAAQNGQQAIVKLLLHYKAKVDFTDDMGRTALHKAAESGHTDIVSDLINNNVGIINQTDEEGLTALYLAAANGNLSVVTKLIEANAKPNQSKNNGASPVYIAAQNGHADVLEVLIVHGADIHQATANGVTPLFVAAQMGRHAAVELLLAHGADTTMIFNTTHRALREFAKIYHVEAKVEELITKKRGASAEFFSAEGKIAIMPQEIAIIMGHSEIAEMIAFGPKVSHTPK